MKLTEKEQLIIELYPERVGIEKDIVNAVYYNQLLIQLKKSREGWNLEYESIYNDREDLYNLLAETRVEEHKAFRIYIDCDNFDEVHKYSVKWNEIMDEERLIESDIERLQIRKKELFKEITFCRHEIRKIENLLKS